MKHMRCFLWSSSLLRFYVCGLLLVLAGCGGKQQAGQQSGRQGQEEGSLQVRYAKCFSLRQHPNFWELTVQTEQQPLRYFLVPEGYPMPQSVPNQGSAQIIRTPVQNLAVMSATHVGMLEALHALGCVRAVSGGEYIAQPQVRKGLQAGEIAELGMGDQPSMELLASLRPQVLASSAFSALQVSRLQPLQALGVVPLVVADWQEQHPLGRAEWVKVFGLLTGREEEAERYFEQVAQRYEHYRSLAAKAQSRPKVLVGVGYQGNWYVPAGESYVARLLADAGGDYLWRHLPGTASVPVPMEEVLALGGKADLWVNQGQFADLASLQGADSRHAGLRPFRQGQVYNNDLRKGPKGNEYFETSVVNPDKVLGDLLWSMHPELLPGYKPYYYRKLP